MDSDHFMSDFSGAMDDQFGISILRESFGARFVGYRLRWTLGLGQYPVALRRNELQV